MLKQNGQGWDGVGLKEPGGPSPTWGPGGLSGEGRTGRTEQVMGTESGRSITGSQRCLGPTKEARVAESARCQGHEVWQTGYSRGRRG